MKQSLSDSNNGNFADKTYFTKVLSNLVLLPHDVCNNFPTLHLSAKLWTVVKVKHYNYKDMTIIDPCKIDKLIT